MLKAYEGDYRQVNRELLQKAFESVPSLILDCGNAADVHSLFGSISEEQLHDVYVINLEAIYRFRKGLEETHGWIKKYDMKQVIVTTIHVLFSYDDEAENHDVLENCWEMMRGISKVVPVHVGIGEDRMHHDFAKEFADKIERVEGTGIKNYHAPRYMR
jgi:hypothetical protein